MFRLIAFTARPKLSPRLSSLMICLVLPGLLTSSCSLDLKEQVKDPRGLSGQTDRSGQAGQRVEDRLPPEEREALVPHEIFSHVLNGRDLNGSAAEDFEAQIANDPSVLHVRNETHGETPLGMAIRLGRSELARRLLDHYSLESLKNTNRNGESYLFLASRAGNIALIEAMAAKLRQRWTLLNEGLNHLDIPDPQGRYAHFVARDKATFQLFEQIHFGEPLNLGRMNHDQADLANRTYLHWAAKDNRSEVVRHTVESYCQVPQNNASGLEWVFQGALNFFRGAGRLAALHFGDLGSFWSVMINRQDALYRSALHWATELKNYQTVDELLQCGWLVPNLQDAQGNTALHLFLKALDPELAQHNQTTKEVFSRLIRFANTHGLRNYGQRELIQVVNQERNTAAHLAAQFRDPFFFEDLKRVHRVTLQDAQGRSPDQIRMLVSRRNAAR